MTNPDDLLAALVATLKDIPELVAAIGGPDNIVAYFHNYPLTVNRLRAINQAQPPIILVACTDTEITRRSRGLAHNFSAALKPLGSPQSVFVKLRDGIVSSSGLKFKNTQVHVSCDPPDVGGCFERTIFITEQSSIDFHEVPIVLTERGADN
jgi:hypothetical protein